MLIGNDEKGWVRCGSHSGASIGKALCDMPALKPYWGRPALRNFRGNDGNVGIVRSPLRAIALSDQSSKSFADFRMAANSCSAS
jgi:hypothetical protein